MKKSTAIKQTAMPSAVLPCRRRPPRRPRPARPVAAVRQLPALTERAKLMWEGFVARLDARLSVAEWIAGDRYSFADLSALVAIDFARAAKLTVPQDAHGLVRWYDRVAARPSTGA
ncbi:glutathione binding-like protein [Sphingomonas sp. MMS24-JH45]